MDLPGSSCLKLFACCRLRKCNMHCFTSLKILTDLLGNPAGPLSGGTGDRRCAPYLNWERLPVPEKPQCSCWGLVARVRSMRHRLSVASPPMPCPSQRCLRPGWLPWSPSQVHRTPQQCLLPLPFSSLLASKGCWQGDTAVSGQTHTQVKGLVQILPQAGLCGCGVAQVSGKWGLLPTWVTCCLVAGTPLLPAPPVCIGSQPPVGTETSAQLPGLHWRRAVRHSGNLWLFQGWGQFLPPLGPLWDRDVLCSGEELLCAAWPGQET